MIQQPIKDLTEVIINYNKFGGIYNLPFSESFTLKDDIMYFNTAENVYIDNNGKVRSREGYVSIDSGSFHSLYSCGEYGYVVKDNYLCYLYNSICSPLFIVNDKISYTKAGDRIYFSDGYIIGWLMQDNYFIIPQSSKSNDFTVAIPPCNHIAYYKGRVYCAVGKYIYYSDAADWNHYDPKSNVIMMPDTITMIAGVDNGLYVSSDKVYFLMGNTPSTFQSKIVIYDKAIERTCAYVPETMINNQMIYNFIIFTTYSGIFIGTGNGEVFNLTKNHYKVNRNTTFKYGVFLDIPNNLQYIAL